MILAKSSFNSDEDFIVKCHPKPVYGSLAVIFRLI